MTTFQYCLRPHTSKNHGTYKCTYKCALLLCPYKGKNAHGYGSVCGAPMALNMPRGIKLQLNNNNNDFNLGLNILLLVGKKFGTRIYPPPVIYKNSQI